MTTFLEGLYFMTLLILALFLIVVFMKWMVDCTDDQNEWYVRYFGSLFFLWLMGMSVYVVAYLLGGLG